MISQLSPITFTVLLPFAIISSYVPDLCSFNILSPPGESSISVMCPDSDSNTWLYGYCEEKYGSAFSRIPLGSGSLKVSRVSITALSDTVDKLGCVAVGISFC